MWLGVLALRLHLVQIQFLVVGLCHVAFLPPSKPVAMWLRVHHALVHFSPLAGLLLLLLAPGRRRGHPLWLGLRLLLGGQLRCLILALCLGFSVIAI